jgi:amino acid transporter
LAARQRMVCSRTYVEFHPRYRTPYVSTILVAGISLGVGVLAANHLDDLTRIVNLGALCEFLLLHVAVIHHFRP